MDNALKYHTIILELLNEFVTFWHNGDGVERKVLYDAQSTTYTLVSYGWQDKKHYLHGITFHLHRVDTKIWIHQNNTQYLIADELVEKGVARKDIVLGFVEPEARAYSGFAVA
jgi:XisI protein